MDISENLLLISLDRYPGIGGSYDSATFNLLRSHCTVDVKKFYIRKLSYTLISLVEYLQVFKTSKFIEIQRCMCTKYAILE